MIVYLKQVQLITKTIPAKTDATFFLVYITQCIVISKIIINY